jgi:hypothetical protein
LSATLFNGWVGVPCDADDLTPVFIAIGGGDWQPAYRDWHEGKRVAKVRPLLSGRQQVILKVSDVVVDVGRLYLP